MEGGGSFLPRGEPGVTREDLSRRLSRTISASSGDQRPEPIVDSQKAQKILEACKWGDIEALKSLAESEGGFLSDDLRRLAWPVLLGLSKTEGDRGASAAAEDAAGKSSEPLEENGLWQKLPRHRDEDQVELDVNRAFIYYPNNQSPAELDRRKGELSDLIVEVLRRYPFLCYFQGYHDICQVFLLVLSAEARTAAVARLSALRIRDFMLPSLAPAIAQLRLLPDILWAADPGLWLHLGRTEPFFALSGTLTMYAHDVQSLREIARLFDALLAREPVFSVYVFAQVVLSRRDELFETPANEPEILHSILSKLPQPLDFDALVTAASALCKTHPPETLRGWRWGISAASVLKTAREPAACAAQSIVDGRVFFDRQVRELQWAERRERAWELFRRNRRPIRSAGLAILVGLLALWLRRPSGPMAYVVTTFSRWLAPF